MKVQSMLTLFSKVLPTLTAITKEKGTAYLVGGSVRDLVLQKPLFDIDIEVHGLTSEQMTTCLEASGPIHLVGKKFGVFRINSIDIDWSLPRKDSLGRKPIVSIDPFMGIKAACKRRDLRMNSMAIELNCDPSKNFGIDVKNIIDPYHGLKDIKNKKLGLIDADLFVQDPLRLYRVIQYIGRFGMEPDDELTFVAKKMPLIDPVTNEPIAQERVGVEIKKMLTLSQYPSKGILWTKKINRLNDTFPHLAQLDTLMSPYTKKNSFEETRSRIDRCAELYQTYIHSHANPLPNDNKKLLALMTTLLYMEVLAQNNTKSNPIITSYGFGIDTKVIHSMLQCLMHFHNSQEPEGYLYKHISKQLAPFWTLYDLFILHEAIFQENTLSIKIKKALDLNVLYKPEVALLDGTYFLSQGLSGKAIGVALEKAYELQIKNNITDPSELKKML